MVEMTGTTIRLPYLEGEKKEAAFGGGGGGVSGKTAESEENGGTLRTIHSIVC